MGTIIRAHDWNSSSLGPPAVWPKELKTLVGLMLASQQPMFIAWGAAQTWLYNDAFAPILGQKHPDALGQPALASVWREARDDLAPLFARVFRGEPVHMQDFALDLNRNGMLEEAHFSFSYTPVRGDEGAVAGLFGACIETTDQVLAQRRQQRAQEHQRRQFEQAPGFIIIMSGPEHVVDFVNDAHREIFGSDGWVGKPIREAFPSIAGQGFYELLDGVLSTGETFSARAAEMRFRRSRDDPEEVRYLDFIYAPIVDESGIIGIFCDGFDVSDRRRLELERSLLVQELEHRMKNMMAMVTAIVSQSFRGASSLATVKEVIANRLAVLANAHDILTNSGWTSASMRDAAESALAPHRTDDARFRVSGPDVMLSPRAALAVALLINELATNAVKYGAISVPQGHVDLTWTLDETGGQQLFRFDWREVGGPPAAAPEHAGFGLRLIQTTLAETFSRDAGIKFTPEGVLCFGVADYAVLKQA